MIIRIYSSYGKAETTPNGQLVDITTDSEKEVELANPNPQEEYVNQP